MKVCHETGSEANFEFGRALMPYYLGMCPPKGNMQNVQGGCLQDRFENHCYKTCKLSPKSIYRKL